MSTGHGEFCILGQDAIVTPIHPYFSTRSTHLIFRSKHHIGKLARSGGRPNAPHRNTKTPANFMIKRVLFGLTVVAGVGFGVLAIASVVVAKNLPNVDTISTYIPAETTKIYSNNDIVLAELHLEENREVIPLENISPFIKQAVLATEDTDFYQHHGINIKGMFRAALKNAVTLSFSEGASTLTQQLARNLFLTKKKKISRKIAEIILALQIERKYTKNEILEMYLNQVYWGHNAYGIESAAQLYFGKHARDLNLAESAMIIGLLKGPELYSPFRNYSYAKQRQRTVLNRMAKLKVITQQQANNAFIEDLQLAQRKNFRYRAPYFTSYIVNHLYSTYGEEATLTSGMQVYTTLDYELQMLAEEVVKTYVSKSRKPYYGTNRAEENYNFSQAALMAVDPTTGYIKVLQGGADYKENQYNRCTQARRQPGSTFKPFVYIAALEKGFSPSSIVQDSPITFSTSQGPYSPANYTHTYLGNITLRKALENSINIVAVKLNNLVGPENIIRLARAMGITSPLQPVLSLPLGANEVTMMELVTAYSVIANNGLRNDPTGIIKIQDREGGILFKHQVHPKRVLDENIASNIVDMMKGAIRYGTGQNANLPRPVAGKTGTTSDYKDAWFIGFVPQLVCATWVGNDDNTPMNKVTGGSVPALMWRDFMKEALKDIPPTDFARSGEVAKRTDQDDSTGNASELPQDNGPPPPNGTDQSGIDFKSL